jgi:hypothetical protein
MKSLAAARSPPNYARSDFPLTRASVSFRAGEARCLARRALRLSKNSRMPSTPSEITNGIM